MNVYDKQYIDGKWVEGSGTVILEDRNPLTNELLYTYRSAGPEDVDAAYRAAEKAQKMWETFLPAQKQAVFEKAINNMIAMEDEIHTVLCEEGGFIKPKREFEYDTCIAFLKTCMKFPEMMTGKIAPSNIPGKENYVFRVPKGVICVIAPWNVPLVLAMRSVVPALAAGNAVVLKPASDTPATASLVAKIFENTGMPDGLLNILTGAGSQIGDEIVQHPIPRLVSFTGSTSVGRHIGEVAGRMLKEVSLELGGNNAMLVLKDANIEDFDFHLNKMSVSGALFDMVKLFDVAKIVISRYSAEKVYNDSYAWAKKYDEELVKLLENKDYALKVLGIERGNAKPRKDIAKWSDLKENISYMYNEEFDKITEFDFGKVTDKDLANKISKLYAEKYFDINDDKQTWFDKMKDLAEEVGFAREVKEWKAEPEKWPGHVGDISSVIRSKLTGRLNTPDLYEIIKVLGKDEVLRRLTK